MSKLYLDCTNGISSDMVLKALIDLDIDEAFVKEQVRKLDLENNPIGSHYVDIVRRIQESDLSLKVQKQSKAIYKAIGIGESKVHGETLNTVHFHEVGRKEAIENIVGVCVALDILEVEEVFCSPIHDGKGTITCSHGEIPVPVPAVEAMKEQVNFQFVTDDIEMEMVTPSGLGILIGIQSQFLKEWKEKGNSKIGIGKGTRDVGREGLKAYLWK